MAKSKSFSLVSAGVILAPNATKKSVQQYKKSPLPKVKTINRASPRGR